MASSRTIPNCSLGHSSSHERHSALHYCGSFHLGRQIMPVKTQFKPGDGPFRFKVKLLGEQGSEVAGMRAPFDVPTIFGTKARVPVRGTINGYPYRSSLCNMGEGHFMVVNKEMRAGGKCKAGDTVAVVMERDREERVVEVPAH